MNPRLLLIIAALLLPATLLHAQTAITDSSSSTTANAQTPLDIYNPISLLDHAASALPADLAAMTTGTLTSDSSASDASATDSPAQPAPKGLSTSLSILILMTVLTLAPSIMVMTTAFTRIVIVLSLLRQAIGTQSLPPSQVIVGLALFMTLIVMQPTFDRINTEAVQPLSRNEIDQMTAWNRAREPLRDFMFAQIDHAGNWDDVYMILEYRQVIPARDRETLVRGDVDMLTLIPAFMLSELKVAFLMGFRLYLPFLIIDMVISSVLISMGMLMLPPVLISLPFKLLLFVLVDGWRLVAGNLLHSFVTAAPAIPMVPGIGT